ncbi:MAG: hypothetical protein OXR68_06870 [Alphaproteobacteria bacterium]|nr:hypothetical protein [Alphaproteobacteria bacterium]MDD9920327.1 hypothetical protein [Alphaproteobacteria bacterium]
MLKKLSLFSIVSTLCVTMLALQTSPTQAETGKDAIFVDWLWHASKKWCERNSKTTKIAKGMSDYDKAKRCIPAFAAMTQGKQGKTPYKLKIDGAVIGFDNIDERYSLFIVEIKTPKKKGSKKYDVYRVKQTVFYGPRGDYNGRYIVGAFWNGKGIMRLVSNNGISQTEFPRTIQNGECRTNETHLGLEASNLEDSRQILREIAGAWAALEGVKVKTN